MALTKSKWILKDEQSLMNGASGDLQVKVTGPIVRSAEGLKIDDLAITNAMIADGTIADGKLVEDYIKADGTRSFTADQDMGGFKLTGVAMPTANSDVVNKEYADSIAAGLDPKASCRVATTENIADLAVAPATIDGITLAEGDRILVKDQTTATENGIYVVDTGALVRATDFDGAPTNEVSGGGFTFIETGSSHEGTGWVVLGDGDLAVGTDDILFAQFSSKGVLTAGNGVTITNNHINVGAGHGVQVDTDSVTVKIDGTTLSKGVDGLRVALAGITESEIAATSLGNGLTGGAGTTLSVVPDMGISVGIDGVTVNIDGTSLSKSAAGLRVADDGIKTVHIDAGAVTETELNASVAGGGIAGGAGTPLSADLGDGLELSDGTTSAKIQLDLNGTTLSVGVDGVKVADAGITETQLNTSVAGAGLSGGAGTPLSVVVGSGLQVTAGVDGVVKLGSLTEDWDVNSATFTITGVKTPSADSDVANKSYVDDSIAALSTRQVETFTLSAADISNKYVDLSSVPRNLSGTGLTIRHAPGQTYSVDYNVTTDGAENKRLSWDTFALDGVLEEGDVITAIYDL